MPFTYTSFSITESFELQAQVGESLQIHIYGAFWNGSPWLSDPAAALTAVNDAFDRVPDLKFSGVQILSSLSSFGAAMAFAVDQPVYKDKIYINPDEAPGLRAAIANALNTGDTGLYLNYGDITLGVSQSAI